MFNFRKNWLHHFWLNTPLPSLTSSGKRVQIEFAVDLMIGVVIGMDSQIHCVTHSVRICRRMGFWAFRRRINRKSACLEAIRSFLLLRIRDMVV